MKTLMRCLFRGAATLVVALSMYIPAQGQGRLVDTDVHGVVIKGSGHWLMEEAPQQVIPQLVAFINKSQ